MLTESITTLLAGGTVGSLGIGGVALFLLKRWLKRTDKKIDDLIKNIHAIEIKMAKSEGREESIFNDIKNDNRMIIRLQDSTEKMWALIHRIAAKMGVRADRVSDKILRMEEEEDV